MTHALQGIEPRIPEIGIDTSFLLDGSDYHFRVVTIGEMVEILESDAFYPGDQGRMEGATIYRLERGRLPETMAVAYRIYSVTEEWVYKVMEIRTSTGKLVAQKGYQIPTLKGYESWQNGS